MSARRIETASAQEISHAYRFFVLAICILATVSSGWSQGTESLAQVKKIYVGPLGDGKGAVPMRNRMAERLQASGKFRIETNSANADAIVKGTGHIWATGYVSPSVHPSRANRQPVYDGFLSVEVEGKKGEVLWSYLVTPSKFTMKPISVDLADQVVSRLLKAVESEPSPTSVVAPEPGSTAVSIHGAGATFPWPLYQKWFESFQQTRPNVHFQYDPVGSESGIRFLTDGALDFAGSDMPLSNDKMEQSKLKVLQVASVLGAVVPIYNLRLNRPLNFTPAALAGIYLGNIKRWNDPMIRESNPGVDLPDREIVVVHRSDGSGTTFAFTDYLSKVSPNWKERVGAPAASIRWPVGRGAERNEGVASLVSEVPDSIGYVELIYAIQHELRFGSVRNAAGTFVKADLASVTAAASTVSETGASDFRLSVANAPGKNAYPIATFTWILLPIDNVQSPKTVALVDFLRWALTSGQKECSGLAYAPLPADVANRELQALSAIK